MPIDPNIPLLAFQGYRGFGAGRLEREKLQALREDRLYQQQQRQQLIEDREFALEEKRQRAESLKLMTDSYRQFTTLDPVTGRPKTDYDKLAGAMFAAGYPDAADRWVKRADEMREAEEKYQTSRMQHDRDLSAWKTAELGMVESPEDYAHMLERFRHVPGIDVDRLPQEYDPEYVQTTIAKLQARNERYQQAIDPIGYQTKKATQEKSAADLAQVTAQTEKLRAETEALAGKRNQTPEDFYKIIDDAMVTTPNAKNFAGSVTMAKGRIAQAFKVGDFPEAKKAVEDLTQELRSVNVARNTAPIRFQWGANGPQALANSIPTSQWASTPDPPDSKTANMASSDLGGITPNAVYQGAIAYILEGRPLQGNTRNPAIVARNTAITNKAGAMMGAANANMSTLRAEYKAKSGTLGKLMSQYNTTRAAENTANLNFDMVEQLSPKVSRTDSKWINEHVQKFLLNFSEAKDLSAFEVAVYTAGREYAKIASGASGSVAGLTDSATQEIERLLSAATSPGALKARLDIMRQDMHNFSEGWGQRIREQSGSIADFLGVSGTGGGAGTGNTDIDKPTPRGGFKDLAVTPGGVLRAPNKVTPTATLPDLSTLKQGQRRRITDGPHRGVWRVGPDGKPVKLSDDPQWRPE